MEVTTETVIIDTTKDAERGTKLALSRILPNPELSSMERIKHVLNDMPDQGSTALALTPISVEIAQHHVSKIVGFLLGTPASLGCIGYTNTAKHTDKFLFTSTAREVCNIAAICLRETGNTIGYEILRKVAPTLADALDTPEKWEHEGDVTLPDLTNTSDNARHNTLCVSLRVPGSVLCKLLQYSASMTIMATEHVTPQGSPCYILPEDNKKAWRHHIKEVQASFPTQPGEEPMEALKPFQAMDVIVTGNIHEWAKVLRGLKEHTPRYAVDTALLQNHILGVLE